MLLIWRAGLFYRLLQNPPYPLAGFIRWNCDSSRPFLPGASGPEFVYARPKTVVVFSKIWCGLPSKVLVNESVCQPQASVSKSHCWEKSFLVGEKERINFHYTRFFFF